MRGHALPARARWTWILGFAILALALSGCTHTLQIESDTAWDGLVNGGSVRLSGSGNRTYKFSGGFERAVLQKQLVSGYLRARVDKRGDWVETTVPYGIIEVRH